jgi:hypothetical protein
VKGIVAIAVAIVMVGCVHKAPTIAHTHVGHAITGFELTPGEEGLFVVAEKRAQETLDHAQRALDATGNFPLMKAEVDKVVEATVSDDYGMIVAMTEADSHVTYAATSADASANVKDGARIFTETSKGIVDRCDTIVLLAGDVKDTRTASEANRYVTAIYALALANVQGEDLDGDDVVGSSAGESGIDQLREKLDAMVAAEDPPYVTVERWYLFNLFQLPDGTWEFPPRWSKGGGGYKKH